MYIFIAIKSHGVQWGILGEVIDHFEQKGFLGDLKFMQSPRDHLKEYCIDQKAFLFLTFLVEYTHRGLVVTMVREGMTVVQTGWAMLGETNPVDYKPRTIHAGDLHPNL